MIKITLSKVRKGRHFLDLMKSIYIKLKLNTGRKEPPAVPPRGRKSTDARHTTSNGHCSGCPASGVPWAKRGAEREGRNKSIIIHTDYMIMYEKKSIRRERETTGINK